MQRVQAIVKKHGLDVDMNPLDRVLTVEGVGAGSQDCTEKASIPMILETGDHGTYVTPVIPNSNVPALLGMVTLESKRALIDVPGKKLYLLGQGEYRIQVPEGSLELSLEKTESGHLMLPITEFTAMSRTAAAKKQHKTSTGDTLGAQQGLSSFPLQPV